MQILIGHRAAIETAPVVFQCLPAPHNRSAFLINLGGELVKTGPTRAERNFAALHAFIFVRGKQRSS
jgi:hypothetical protein